MNPSAVRDLLLTIIRQQPESDKAVTYLTEQAAAYRQQPSRALFYRVFAAIPRFTDKGPVQVSPEQAEQLAALRPNFSVSDWPLDRLARVWWLLQLPTDEQATYVATIETLIKAAEMNELAAVYAAFPVLSFPEYWRFQATEAVRNNMAPVQEAIMIRNPYPADYLDEPAWNQLIMKAFFTDKPVEQIIGFDARANERLARMVIDYARERRAAGRTVHPALWRLARPFLSQSELPELEPLFGSSGR